MNRIIKLYSQLFSILVKSGLILGLVLGFFLGILSNWKVDLAYGFLSTVLFVIIVPLILTGLSFCRPKIGVTPKHSGSNG